MNESLLEEAKVPKGLSCIKYNQSFIQALIWLSGEPGLTLRYDSKMLFLIVGFL